MPDNAENLDSGFAAYERERQENGTSKPNGPTSWTQPDPDFIRQHTGLDFWLEREIAPLDPMLGDLFTCFCRGR